DPGPTKVVPKGLRSFDAADADFFLELLPGPRNREGLPDSLRFWKLRLEATDPDQTFRVGLLYGPSGCGKSSLVKAGLLPRLAEHVLPVYLEATPEDMESRLLHGLRRLLDGDDPVHARPGDPPGRGRQFRGRGPVRTAPRPQGVGGVWPGLRRSARGQSDCGAGAFPRRGGGGAGPGRQGNSGSS